MAGLGEFLERAGRKPFEWGVHDCLLFPAAWCIEQGLPDPAAAYRGRYRTRLGAIRLLNKAGGMIALAEHQLAGCERVTGEPQRGDVGVVRAPTPSGKIAHVGGIFTGAHWVVLAVSGIVGADFIIDGAWRLPCLKS